jgi:DNA ligase (NAD+)
MPMLSTEKSYSIEETQKWIERIKKEASKNNINPNALSIIVTAKLDGLAAMRREDGLLASRGDGIHGNDITSVFDKGVVDAGKGISGVGELVMETEYFDKHIKKLGYAHPRNICVGVVNSDEVNKDFIQALKDKAVRFVPYTTLDRWEGGFSDLIDQHEKVQDQIIKDCVYPTDGVVAEITHTKMKTLLGATNHHNRWQIAIKKRSPTKQTRVKKITWQTGRTGRVTPVLEVESIELSGAIVSRITAHNAGNVKVLRLGTGAVVEAERSGEVIPKIVSVIQPTKRTNIINKCPSCQNDLFWDSDFLVCPNHDKCPAQVATSLGHFFKLHGQVDGFGPKSIEKMVSAEINTLKRIFAADEEAFQKAGFGETQSRNLRKELERALNAEIEDWRFLAGFGVAQLGKGDSKRLLQNTTLIDLFDLTEQEIGNIDGFASLSAKAIVQGLKQQKTTIIHMLSLGFNLLQTPLLSTMEKIDSPIAGLRVVFSGKMTQGSRDDMKNNAEALGAVAQDAISSTTNLLVCGESVGNKKLEKAKKLSVNILNEKEYLSLIKS